MLATTVSATLLGIEGQRVVVEVHCGGGLPAFHVVGLPDAACREARDRVRAAIVSSGFNWPKGRVTVNLAPSGVRKEGAGLDLAIAVGILAASDNGLNARLLDKVAFLAELGLDGALRTVPGIISLASAPQTPVVVVAAAVGREAELAGVECVRSANTLGQVVACLRGDEAWPAAQGRVGPPLPSIEPDLADVAGHPLARQALEVAAAGAHNLLLVGPPGTGKSMLARRLPGLLPDLDATTALTATRIHSVAGLALPDGHLVSRSPFRSPHHSASMTALIGGGSGRLRPGEISCAHGGVLFLDELGEFAPRSLDALRQPLEEGTIAISRAHGSVVFPAEFCLIAAMNPCPCGLLGSTEVCRCSEAARQRYARRLSGPLLDRIDLRVHMRRPEPDELFDAPPGESTAEVRHRVLAARSRAVERAGCANARIPATLLDDLVVITADAQAMLRSALVDGRLSARGLDRVRRVARTVADLEDFDPVDERSMAVALALRARPAVFDALEVGHV